MIVGLVGFDQDGFVLYADMYIKRMGGGGLILPREEVLTANMPAGSHTESDVL